MTEVALAVVLLASAGLLFRSVEQLLSEDTGFEAANVLTMEVTAAGYADQRADATLGYFQSVVDAVRSVPGVTEAAFTSQLPLLAVAALWRHVGRSVHLQRGDPVACGRLRGRKLDPCLSRGPRRPDDRTPLRVAVDPSNHSTRSASTESQQSTASTRRGARMRGRFGSGGQTAANVKGFLEPIPNSRAEIAEEADNAPATPSRLPKIARHDARPEPLGRPILGRHQGGDKPVNGQVDVLPGRLAQVNEVGIGKDSVASLSRVETIDTAQAFRFDTGQGREINGVEEAENPGASPNSDRQQEHDERSPGRTPAHLLDGFAKVVSSAGHCASKITFRQERLQGCFGRKECSLAA